MAGMAQGAVDSLLGRLTSVLLDEAQLLGGLRGDVEFIKDEMESMNSLLLHLSEAQHRAHHVRTWTKQVVNLARDCEGYVELYIRRVGAGEQPSSNANNALLRHLRRLLRLLGTIPARHQVATRIRELKDRARDVGDRRLRYGITVPPAPPPDQASARAIADRPAPPAPGGPEEEEDLQRREQLLFSGDPPDTVKEGADRIIGWLEGWYEWWPELEYDKRKYRYNSNGPWVPRVIFIVGQGRVGKTSIARRALQHPSLQSLFRYRVWINLGGLDKDFGELRTEIMAVLAAVDGPEIHCRNVVDTVRYDSLMYKQTLDGWLLGKLLVVLDGVRPEYIKDLFAPPALDGMLWDLRCYVIVTAEHVPRLTFEYRVFDVLESKVTLPGFFRRRALALVKSGFPPVLEVLQECYPNAFALQMFLHLLYVNPERPERELSALRRALQEDRNNVVKTMLMFCYSELPTNYKTCLLYLSIFPPDRIIRRTSLVRRWLAEGLVTQRSITLRADDKSRHGTSKLLEDQAECIFNALVDRGFLRPGETSIAGKIKSCTVHHIVHEFIATDVSFGETSLPLDLAYRLSINSGIAVQEASSLSHGPFDGILPLLESMTGSAQWQLLKVLDLEGCTGLKKKHLKSICKILLLKYLSLRGTDVTELPKEIEKLQCLETLDIRQTEIVAFSTKSVKLTMLKHFLSGHASSPRNSSDRFTVSLAAVRLPSGIQRMKQLEVLSHVEVSNNVNDLINIGQLLQLRKLGVILHGRKGELSLLFQQIEKLCGVLHSLSIQIKKPTRSESAADSEVMPDLVNPPKLLESLNISGIIARGLPIWIAALDQLSKITLRDTSLGEEDIHILGKLRMLLCLQLLQNSYSESKIGLVKADEFQRLRFLVIEGSNIINLSFGRGVAPKLELIVWSFSTLESLTGVDHLPKLKKVELTGDCNNLDPVKAAIQKHPNHPELKHNQHHQRQEDGTAAAASSSSAP